MRRDAGRAALWLVGAALGLAVLLALWLARGAAEDPAVTAARAARSAPNPDTPPPLPRFDVEPLATEAGDADVLADGDAAAAPVDPLGDGPSPLRALVVHADDTPAAGATVVAAAGDVVIDTQITDAHGAAQFSITDGRVELYVGGATPTPQRFEIEPAHGVHRLELPAGAFVGGVVLLDGQPPEEPIGLVLKPEGDDEWPGIPSTVRVRLSSIDTFFDLTAGLRTTSGRFLFGGLPPGWNGSIDFPAIYQLEDQGAYAQFTVERPSTDLVMRLTWGAALTGRVLRPSAEASAEPQPAPSADMTVMVTRDGGSFVRSGFRTDDDGRFRIPLHAESAASVDLDIRDTDGDGRLALHVGDIDPVLGRDLGDVVLLAARAVEFLARDDGGQPLAGAVATALDATQARSKPTGEDGRGVLPGILPDTTTLRVEALGFHPTDVDVPRQPGVVVEAVLHRAPSLRIRILGPDGAPARRIAIEYRAGSKPFDSEDGGPAPLQITLGATDAFVWGWDGAEARGRVRTDSEGTVLFTRLRAGLPLAISVEDDFGLALRPTETITLAPGEQRRIEWRIDATARSLSVALTDDRDAPVAGAEVTLLRPPDADTYFGSEGSSRYTNTAGITAFTDLRAGRVTLQARKSGLATAWIRDVAIPASGAHVELTMSAGRTVDVDVVDSQGQLRKVDGVAVTDAPAELAADELDVGRYRLTDLPSGTVTIAARIDERDFTLRHDTSIPHARLTIPVLGSIRATWTATLTADGSYNLFLRAIAPDTWSSYRRVSDEARSSRGPIEFGEVLPGDYEVVLRQGRGWTGDNPPISQVARVTVKAGEVTEVLLEP